MSVNVEQFGEDHWSNFAYVVYKVAGDMTGIIDEKKMRDKSRSGWKPNYGTKLKGFKGDYSDSATFLPEHDDYDCLEDLEAAKLITFTYGVLVRLTDLGWSVARQISDFKIGKGGKWSEFTPNLVVSER